MIEVIKAEDVFNHEAYSFYLKIIGECLSNRLGDEKYRHNEVILELVNMQCAIHQIAIVVEEKSVKSKKKLELNKRQTYRLFKHYLDIGFDVDVDENTEAGDLKELIVDSLQEITVN